MNEELDQKVHDICLVIDNCAPVLARLLLQIRLAKKRNEEAPATIIRLYIKQNAGGDMWAHGDKADRENAKLLRQSLVGLTDRAWAEIASHYLAKHAEGERLLEYLTPELVAVEEKGAWA